MAVRICKVDEIKAGKAIRVKVGELQIAIFKTKDGEVFALDDKCSHGEISLSEGFIGKDKTVECWAHGAKFSLETRGSNSPCLRTSRGVRSHRRERRDFPRNRRRITQTS